MSIVNLRDLLRRYAGLWGPTTSPPEAVVQALEVDVQVRAPRVLLALSEGAPEAFEELQQFVIGFGLRSRFRPLISGAPYRPEWDAVWPKAAQWLRDVVWTSMNAVSRYLEFGLSVQGYAFQPHPELSNYIALSMTNCLIEGRCLCPMLALKSGQGGGAVMNFLRRLLRCLREHSLAGWDPNRVSLRNFVVQAVKGSHGKKGHPLQPGALVQGMHFVNLHSLSNLRFEDVLVWVCPVDGTYNFEGLPCRACRANGKMTMVGDAWRTVVRRLVVPESLGGRYAQDDYFNCQHCRKKRAIPGDPFFPGGNYYPADRLVCPKCNRGRLAGAKRSTVYVFRPRIDLTFVPLDLLRTGQAGFEPNDIADEPDICIPGEAVGQSAEPEHSGSPVPTVSHLQLAAAVASLDAPQRRLIRLMFWGRRLELDEAALELGISSAEAEKLHRHAMQELRKLKQGEDNCDHSDD